MKYWGWLMAIVGLGLLLRHRASLNPSATDTRVPFVRGDVLLTSTCSLEPAEFCATAYATVISTYLTGKGVQMIVYKPGAYRPEGWYPSEGMCEWHTAAWMIEKGWVLSEHFDLPDSVFCEVAT